MAGMAPHDLVDVRVGVNSPDWGREPHAAERRMLLTDALLDGVIPYLSDLPPAPKLVAQDIARFAGLIVRGGGAAEEEVRRLRSFGMEPEAICLDLFAPAARLLGQWWHEDRCSFIDVTVGVGRLHQLLRGIASRPRPAAVARRILLTAVPQEQHLFGLAVLADVFSRAGWETTNAPRLDRAALTAVMRDDWFDVVGISIGSETRLALAADAVRTVRQVSRNSKVRVIAGGPALLANPDAVECLGADGVADCARNALRLAECLRVGP